MFTSETNSTNDDLRLLAEQGAGEYSVVATDYQSAGRGQAGNSWESEHGKNLLFSVLVRPVELHASEQFRLSMWVSLALVNVLNRLQLHTSSQQPLSFSIKWPNDIYCGDSKLAGILIENSLAGSHIAQSIIGIGLNVNQTHFVSDAPNPTSLKRLTGQEFDREQLLQAFFMELQALRPLLPTIGQPESGRQEDALSSAYLRQCYRRKGYFPYVEREVSLQPTAIARQGASDIFEAEMAGITDSGELLLRLRDGSLRTYHFKQIRFVI